MSVADKILRFYRYASMATDLGITHSRSANNCRAKCDCICTTSNRKQTYDDIFLRPKCDEDPNSQNTVLRWSYQMNTRHTIPRESDTKPVLTKHGQLYLLNFVEVLFSITLTHL